MHKEISCGTIVIHNNKVLLVESKKGICGFPKGHMEAGETEIETAIRETKEETNVDVIVDSTKKYKISYIVKKTVPKDVIFFLAKPKGEINLIAQESEIKKAFWVDINEVQNILSKENLKEIWKQVLLEI